MTVLLNNALTGLFAAQAGMRTTSNNTANVNTEGYTRQRVNQSELPGHVLGKISIGNGVIVDGVERVYDRFLVDRLREASSLEQRSQVLSEFAQRVDRVLGDTQYGIAPALQEFFAQLQVVANDSTSVVNRQSLIAQGESLEQRMHQFAAQLDGLDEEVNRRITDIVSTINVTAGAIAELNDQIVAAGATASNDLLDRRERLLTSLSELVDIHALPAQDGAINVLIGNGRPLVLATQSFELETVRDDFDPSRLLVAHNIGTRTEDVSRQISGGKLGGLLAFRQEALDPARRSLGTVAFGLTASFNAQHALGVDLNGNTGGDFFGALEPRVTSAVSNTGSGALTATVLDATAVQARDYLFRFDGSGWQVTDANTGALLTATGAGTSLDPLVIDGLAVVVTPGAAPGDRFMVRPVSEAAAFFAVELSDPLAFAAASPLSTQMSLGNIGDASIAQAQIDDVTNPALQQAVDIVFDDASTYRIFDSFGSDLTGPLPYTSGADITFNGWRVQVSGAPSAGDSFSVAPTAPGSGDNANVIALTATRSRGYLDGGRTTVNDTIGNVVASVGGAALRASQTLAAQSSLRQTIEMDVQNVSGVNLDEEAVNALRYQEAFMASSRLIAMADDLFQAVLNAVGRR